MPKPGEGNDRQDEIVRKISSILAAAGAILAQQPIADASPFRLLNQTAQNVTALQADDRSTKRPPPLVLTPAIANASATFVGHRSHSSHSSHRSHVSSSTGRSHSSHYSGISMPSASPRSLDTPDPPAREDRKPKRQAPVRVVPPTAAELQPASPAPLLKVNFDDPTQRFHVISFMRAKDVARATILDRKTSERQNVVENDMLADYRVIRIDMVKRIVQLRGPTMDSVVLRLKKKGEL